MKGKLPPPPHSTAIHSAIPNVVRERMARTDVFGSPSRPVKLAPGENRQILGLVRTHTKKGVIKPPTLLHSDTTPANATPTHPRTTAQLAVCGRIVHRSAALGLTRGRKSPKEQ
ncbi:hypothetical protein ZHAS_00016122 [Anopheles sinensis]|uniref:Uncharacterized protein n=1 Tax=Anopheles sinensis TaxID=74873 RepID=A0A084WCR2_ANOSI|nr:hypothetical protein ZHAS_00016122 [Anopheles sinensis]